MSSVDLVSKYRNDPINADEAAALVLKCAADHLYAMDFTDPAIELLDDIRNKSFAHCSA